MLLGAIADDFTGATDLCSMLVRGGMRTVQLIGVPGPNDPVPEADAVVVALKSRTAPVRQAVGESLAALDWLRKAGCEQYFFKYCSTFDSTDDGNIGPVADALVNALGSGFALACPAFPPLVAVPIRLCLLNVAEIRIQAAVDVASHFV